MTDRGGREQVFGRMNRHITPHTFNLCHVSLAALCLQVKSRYYDNVTGMSQFRYDWCLCLPRHPYLRTLCLCHVGWSGHPRHLPTREQGGPAGQSQATATVSTHRLSSKMSLSSSRLLRLPGDQQMTCCCK